MKYTRSWQTGEGRAVYVKMGLGCIAIAYLLWGENDPQKLEDLLKSANSFTEIAEAYKDDIIKFSDVFRTGNIGMILAYLYKESSQLFDSRTKIKLNTNTQTDPV